MNNQIKTEYEPSDFTPVDPMEQAIDGYAPILGRELVTGTKGDNTVSVVHNLSARFTNADVGGIYCAVTLETMNRKLGPKGVEIRSHAQTRHIPAYELVATMYPEFSNEHEIKAWRESMAPACARDKAIHERQTASTAARFAAQTAPAAVRIINTAPQI